MKKILTYLIIISLFISCKINDSSREVSKPNVIIILTDDQGYQDVGFNGCLDIPTPNIDRVAHEGVIFSKGYVSFPVCGPSRAGLITGRYQGRFGFGRNPLFAPNDSTMGLPLSEENMGEAMKKGGYATMAIGKWHLGAHESMRPLNRGFDEFFGFLSGGHQYFPEQWIFENQAGVKTQYGAYRTKLLKNDKRIEESEYLTDALSREAVDFLERNADKPFFLYLAYNAPHSPLQATEKYLNRFSAIKNEKRRTYAAMVSAVDDGVGALLDKLDELNIADNTIVFFLSDNGGPEKNNGSDNGPLRDGKSSLHEGGIRVPFAMRWPAVIKDSQIYNESVISLDIFATAVSNAGIPSKNPLDGVDLIPYLTGEIKGKPHENLFWRKFDSQCYAVQNNHLKLVNYLESEDAIYDLSSDTSEKNPLNSEKEKEKMLELFSEWNQMMIDPVFTGLMQDKEYSKAHPDRWEVEPY